MSKLTVFTGALMLVIGLAAGHWLAQDRAPFVAASGGEVKPLYYRNPMNPNITSPVPAKDSMGMDYIPVYQDDPSDDAAGTVKIDPSVTQNIGVRTSIARSESMSRTVRTVGRIQFNEERMARLHPKVQGWIEDMRIDKTGEPVAQDDILLSIYSPKLVSTQQEYLLALNNLSALGDSPIAEIRLGAEDLVQSSRERLQLLDVPEHQILELEKTREIKKQIHIHSPVEGTVLRIGARPGQYVTPQTELYRFADLEQVWVLADIYDNEIPWVKVGDQVEMTLASVPGKTFQGQLSYIYPYAEADTRTTKVRFVVDNPELLLRPDMFAEVVILSDTREDAVVIPAEAVVRSGGEPTVLVVREPGQFDPRVVVLGVESAGRVEVLGGIRAGEEVVTSAQFLLDSESKLREATAKMMRVLESGSSSGDSMSPASDSEDTMQMNHAAGAGHHHD